MDEPYSNIRQILGQLIGKKVVDITQHDEEEWKESKQAYIMLMFEDGLYLKCHLDEVGIETNADEL